MPSFFTPLTRRRGNHKGAERLYRRALSIKEKALGPEHPDIAMTLNNLAVLYKSENKLRAAAPLYLRALTIFEHALGSKHPNTIVCRTNYAELVGEMKLHARRSRRRTRT